MKSPIGTLVRSMKNKTPIDYSPNGRFNLPWFGVRTDAQAQLAAMGAVGTLFAIVHRTSNATAQVNWRLFRKKTDARRTTASPDMDEPRTEVTRHAAIDLWNKPNKFMTGFQFREAAQQHVDLTGESYIVVYSEFNIPLELWPVRPDRMTPVPSSTDFLAGWVYTGPNGERVPLNVGEVIPVQMPNPLDPYRGLGPVQAAMVDLDSTRYSAEWNRNFFINGAEPGGIVEYPDGLSEEEFKQQVTRWREQHQGVHNAHRVAMIEKGHWVERKYNQKDMQFAELRKLGSEFIMEAFGIHSHMLGKTEDVNKANAQEAERHFARWLTTPRVLRWKEALNFHLLPMFGPPAEGLEFDHDTVVPEDREADDRERTSKAQSAQLILSTEQFEPEDVLTAFGLPPMRVKTPAPVE